MILVCLCCKPWKGAKKSIFFFNDWKTDHLNQRLRNCKFLIKKKNLFKSILKWLKWRNAYNQFRSDKCRESNSEPYDCIKEPWIASKELVGCLLHKKKGDTIMKKQRRYCLLFHKKPESTQHAPLLKLDYRLFYRLPVVQLNIYHNNYEFKLNRA